MGNESITEADQIAILKGDLDAANKKLALYREFMTRFFESNDLNESHFKMRSWWDDAKKFELASDLRSEPAQKKFLFG